MTLLNVFAARQEIATERAVRVGSVLFMTALTAAAAQFSIPIPFSAVPFTFQPTVVLLAGLTLGSRLGAVSQILYLALGVAGLPVFAASPLLAPGILRLLGPTGGFLLAYPLAAFLVGRLAERGLDRRYIGTVAAMWVGMLTIYASGAVWLGYLARTVAGTSAAIGLSAAMTTGVFPFVLADAVKILLAASITPSLWRLSTRE